MIILEPNEIKWAKNKKAPWEKAETPLESSIEGYAVKEFKKRGWIFWKFTSPNNRSVPDRFVGLPGGVAVFIEFKAPGKASTDKQRAKQQELADSGFIVFRDIDTKEKVGQVIEYCKGLIK